MIARTTILVADPLAIFRTGVRNLLQRESDLKVLEAATFDDVSQIVEAGCPDIALIDLELPPTGGVEAVRLLSERCSCQLIVWSFDPSREAVLAAVRAGANGYLHKRISPTGLVRSLRGVSQGEAPLSRDLATLMIDALHGVEEQDRSRERLSLLSLRERQILSYVSEGARNRQIATALTISEFTVKRHVQNILGKLDVPSRRTAGEFYRRAAQELARAGAQVPA